MTAEPCAPPNCGGAGVPFAPPSSLGPFDMMLVPEEDWSEREEQPKRTNDAVVGINRYRSTGVWVAQYAVGEENF